MDSLQAFIKWSNDNSGLVSEIILGLTIIFGVFKALQKRPKFIIKVIEGPTLISSFPTGRKYKEHVCHRTALSLYLDITNRGSAPSSIGKIAVAYHNTTFRFTFFWFWLEKETNALTDFRVSLGDHIKIYPFLKQINLLSPVVNDTYLDIGKGIAGIVYFEQNESWGGFKPRTKNGKVRIKIRVTDGFGHAHTTSALIPNVTLDEAKKFSPTFGETLESIPTQ